MIEIDLEKNGNCQFLFLPNSIFPKFHFPQILLNENSAKFGFPKFIVITIDSILKIPNMLSSKRFDIGVL